MLDVWQGSEYTSLPELCLSYKVFILLLQRKEVIAMTYGSNTSCWKSLRWMKVDLIFTVGNICINFNLLPFMKFGSSSRSFKLKDSLSWNCFDMVTKTIPISKRIAKSCTTESMIISIWPYQTVKENEATNWSEFHKWVRATGEQYLGSEARNNPKRAELWPSQTGIWIGKSVWVRSCKRYKNHLQSSPS